MGNSLIFDGINSADYGVILSGGGTYATPERDVTVVSVPGRNGDVILDNGRYNNIQIVYTAGISKGFETKFLPFIGALKAVKGYAKLFDSYHPEEFRLASFRSELVPEVGTIMRSGKFELVFDCMPQRFLKSGELPVSFTDSSKAQQTIYKYSDFSSYTKTSIIDPISAEIGMDLSDSLFYVVDMSGVTLADDEMIRVEGGFDKFFVALCSNNPVSSSSNASGYQLDDTFLLHQYDSRAYWLFPAAANIKIYAEDTLVYESPNTEHETMHNQTMFGAKLIVKVDIATGYDVTDYLFAIGSNGVMFAQPNIFPYNQAQTITIDCEAMEAYSLPRDNPAGYKVNWNPYVTFVKAPELMPGDNDIAYDATVSNLRIIPRWWRL